jgi:hypothetical protein
MPLRQFALRARLPGVRLFSLQKYAGSEQLGEMREAFALKTFRGAKGDLEGSEQLKKLGDTLPVVECRLHWSIDFSVARARFFRARAMNPATDAC